MKLCLECQAPAEHDHHVIPRSLGGTATVPLCSVHHAMVHGAPGLVSTAKLTSLAMKKKRAKGEYTGGRVPFGHCLAPDGSLVPVEAEQVTVAFAKKYRAEGLSLLGVAKRLAKRGFFARNGKVFQSQQVAAMVADR